MAPMGGDALTSLGEAWDGTADNVKPQNINSISFTFIECKHSYQLPICYPTRMLQTRTMPSAQADTMMSPLTSKSTTACMLPRTAWTSSADWSVRIHVLPYDMVDVIDAFIFCATETTTRQLQHSIHEWLRQTKTPTPRHPGPGGKGRFKTKTKSPEKNNNQKQKQASGTSMRACSSKTKQRKLDVDL